MIERVAVRHLESSGRHILHSGRLAKGNGRSALWRLHSGDLQTASRKVQAKSVERQPAMEGSNSCSLSDSRIPPEFSCLDFLYPASTLDFIHCLSATLPRRRRVGTSHRSAFSFVLPKRFYSTVTTPSKTYTHLAKKDANVRRWPKKPRRYPGQPKLSPRDKLFPNLDELRKSKIPGLFNQAYDLFLKIKEPRTGQRVWTLKYLLSADKEKHFQRIIKIVSDLPLHRRTPNDNEALVTAYLRIREPSNAWAALETIIESRNDPAAMRDAGFEVYIVYYAVRRNWEEVLRAYGLLRSKPADLRMRLPSNPQDLRIVLNTGRMGWLRKDYIWNVFEWADQLPGRRSDVRTQLEDECAEDLLKGCLYHQTRWGRIWTPGTERIWSFITNARRHWVMSRQKWERMMLHLIYNQKSNWALQVYQRYITFKAPESISIAVINGLMEILGKRQNIEGMRYLVHDIFSRSELNQANRPTYGITMKHLARLGEAQAVESLMQMYLNRYTPRSAKEFAHVMQAYSKKGDLSGVVRWFNRISDEYGMEPDPICYNILINVHSKAGEADNVINQLEDMLQSGLEPDVITYTALMDTAARRGDAMTVEAILSTIKEKNFRLDMSMFKNLAMALIKAGFVGESEAVIARAKKECPNQCLTPVYNAVLSGFVGRSNRFGLIKDYKRVVALFEEMIAERVPFNSQTYSILIHSYVRARKIRKAQDTLDFLQKANLPGVPLTANKYAAVMMGHAHAGRHKYVWTTFQNMLKDKIPPNFATFSILIRSLATVEGSDETEQGLPNTEKLLIEIAEKYSDTLVLGSPEQVKTSIPPYVFNPVLRFYAKAGALERTIRYFELFLSLSQSPDPEQREPNIAMYEAMMIVFRESGETEGVKAMWEALKNRAWTYFAPMGADPDAKILPQYKHKLHTAVSILIRSLSNVEDLDGIRDEVQALRKKGYELNAQNVNEFIQALCLCGKVLEGVKTCEETLLLKYDPQKLDYVRRRYAYEPDTRAHLNNPYPDNRPYIRTLEAIATELKALADRRWRGDATADHIFRTILTVAPNTVQACKSLARLNERIDKEMLHRMNRMKWLDELDINPVSRKPAQAEELDIPATSMKHLAVDPKEREERERQRRELRAKIAFEEEVTQKQLEEERVVNEQARAREEAERRQVEELRALAEAERLKSANNTDQDGDEVDDFSEWIPPDAPDADRPRPDENMLSWIGTEDQEDEDGEQDEDGEGNEGGEDMRKGRTGGGQEPEAEEVDGDDNYGPVLGEEENGELRKEKYEGDDRPRKR